MFKKIIKNYINQNRYLFATDNVYTINCHLKPRLIANSVEKACTICKNKKLFDRYDKDYLENISTYGIIFAIKYLNKTNKKGEKNVL